MKIRTVSGYKGSAEAYLALERGDVGSHANFLAGNVFRFLEEHL